MTDPYRSSRTQKRVEYPVVNRYTSIQSIRSKERDAQLNSYPNGTSSISKSISFSLSNSDRNASNNDAISSLPSSLKRLTVDESPTSPVVQRFTNGFDQHVVDTSPRFERSRLATSSVGITDSSSNSSAYRREYYDYGGRQHEHTSTSSPSSAPLNRRLSRSNEYGSWRNGGLVGLNNLGNTCYMNSIIQCLSNTRPLLEYCLSEYSSNDINQSSTMRGNLFNGFVSLIGDIWRTSSTTTASSSHSISPGQFKSQMQKFAPRFYGYLQHDSQEFLRYVLEGLHMEVNRVSIRPKVPAPDYAAEDKLPDAEKAKVSWKRYLSVDNSPIVDLFVGQLMSTLQCEDCGFKSTTFDPFWDLSLSIPKKPGVNIVDCLKLFTSKEVLDGDERPTHLYSITGHSDASVSLDRSHFRIIKVCAKCKSRRRCTKFFLIHKFPRILVLHLKRFSGERFRSKMSVLVDYPVDCLDLTPYASPSCQQHSPVYTLYAVSNHSGSVYAGHYTANCRHPFMDSSWYEFNDSRVRQCNSSSVVSAEGYVLFYQLMNQQPR